MSQIWLITDCSRGLGRSLAEAVLAAGHQLVATARNPAQLVDLVEHYGTPTRQCVLLPGCSAPHSQMLDAPDTHFVQASPPSNSRFHRVSTEL